MNDMRPTKPCGRCLCPIWKRFDIACRGQLRTEWRCGKCDHVYDPFVTSEAPEPEVPTKYTYTATALPDFTTGDIELRESINGMTNAIAKQVMHTKDQAVQKALIALGWTPPDYHPIHNESGRYRHQRDRAERYLTALHTIAQAETATAEKLRNMAAIAIDPATPRIP